MSRRVRLPGAEELFRSTADPQPDEHPSDPAPELPEDAAAGAPTGSGRVKHDEKMTVYVTVDELMSIEQARLALRRELGQAVDRGRLVREAIALALADFDERGVDSDLAERLRRR